MSARKIKVFLAAGEPSGDLLAARLMRALKAQTNGLVEFVGVGGEAMRKEGMSSLFPISELSVMGFWEVVPSIPRILRRICETVDAIEREKPDIVVTVDSWSFSKQVHLRIQKKKLQIPHIHYVAPQVWAWKEKRARQIKKWVDYLLLLLPFEEKYFAPYGMPMTYVGHPVIEGGADQGNAKRFLEAHDLSSSDLILTVLPGSRKTEIKYLLPVFREVIVRLIQKYPHLQVVTPTVETVKKQVKAATMSWPVKPLIVTGEQERYDAFAASRVALSASGTVSLELSMAKVPHLIAYKVSPITAWLVRRLIKIKYVNLINILADEKIIPELLQEDCNPDQIMLELEKLMTEEGCIQQKKAFAVLKKLGAGEKQTPSEKASEVIRKLITDNEH